MDYRSRRGWKTLSKRRYQVSNLPGIYIVFTTGREKARLMRRTKYHHPKTAVKRLTATRHRRFSYPQQQQQQHIDILAMIYTARNLRTDDPELESFQIAL
jgi:hypothetical protein